MTVSIEQVASDWIAPTGARGRASNTEHERGWVLYDFARVDPERAWEAIVDAVSRYGEADAPLIYAAISAKCSDDG